MEEEKQTQEIPSEEEEQTQDTPVSPSDDDFVIGKGFTIEEPEAEIPGAVVEETKQPVTSGKKKKKKEKKNRWIVGTVIRIFLILFISVALTFGIVYAGMDYLGITLSEPKNITFNIVEGTSVKQIAEQLKEEGVIRCPLLFRVYARFKHYDSKFQWGLHTFSTEDGYGEIATVLSQQTTQGVQKKVRLLEGYNVDQMAKALEEAGVCMAADFIDEVQHGTFSYDFVKEIPKEKVYYRLEGYLFPDTYYFYCYDPESDSDPKEFAHMAVDTLLKETDKNLTEDLREKIKNSGYTLHEIMTMASVVELEAGSDHSEMANVSAIFWNRMKSDAFRKLESSPTKKYPYGSQKYDTYETEGLPPGPLCSPSLEAIKAAAEPTPDFDYYYFVTDAKMKFYYNKTLAEHNNTIARLKKENNWIGDQ